MFKAARWRSEKNRITAVFKLQFHVTQVSEFGRNGLVLSLITAENGKPTAKLEKCTMKENGCYWENPVYETVKLIQDPKTGKIHERIYYFIISTGSSKGSLVGEFSVNIADYVEATNAYSVAFPFKNSNSNSHLHVSIQRIHENRNQRDLEEDEGEKVTPEDRSSRLHLSNGNVEEDVKTNSVEDEPLRTTVSYVSGLNGMRRGSSGSDITLSSSDSSCGLDTPRELGVRNNNTNRDQTSNISSYQDQQRTRWDLAIVPANGLSTDFSMNSPRDAFSSDISHMGSDDSVEKLKADLVAFSRKAEMSDLELQTLRKQIVKENKKGKDMLKEITCLKEERDSLKDECEKLKTSRRSKLQFEGDSWTLLEEIREELNYEKDLNANLRLQLQKTQESNAELILAVQDLEEMLEKNIGSNQPNRSASGDIIKSQSDDDEDQMALEELVKQHSDAQGAHLLEQKIMDLCSELEMYRRDKDELEIQMEQLALDYEILKQENHEFSSRLEQSHLQEQLKMQYESSSSYAAMIELETQREKLQNELKEQSRELSHCLATIKELEAHNQSLEEDLVKQVEGYKADMKAVSCAQMEQEKRAARAEEALSQSTATINELEAEIQKLKKELKKQLEEFSCCVITIDELETHNHNLEQRALKAEEAVSGSNATIKELDSCIKRLENELKAHSEESSDTLAKFKELESQIQFLEEELEKQEEGFEVDLEAVTRAKVEQEQRAIRAEESLKLMRWKNANTAARIQDEFKRLSVQMQSSFEANEKLASKALSEASELRLQNRHLQDMLQNANEELQSTKDDYGMKIQELYGQINMKSTQIQQMVVEFEEKSKQFENQRKHTDEQMKTLIKEGDVLVQGENMGRDNLKDKIASMEEEVGKSLKEINELRHLKDKKEEMVMNLHSEVETLRAQCDNLKHSLCEDELEKEKLCKQVFQLKADLRKKDEMISSIEKKSKENNGRFVVHDRSRATSKNMKSEQVQRGSKEFGAKEVATLKEKIKLLEGQIKSKETAFETSANAFLAKEKDLHGKIEELEIRLELVGQSIPGPGQDKVEEKVSIGMQVDCIAEEVTSAGESQNLNDTDLIYSDVQLLSQTEPKTSDKNPGEQQTFDVLLEEIVLLKENNDSMEMELKEMQERYLEISLKFAEVEGERQQLVMTLRNLKNAKKC